MVHLFLWKQTYPLSLYFPAQILLLYLVLFWNNGQQMRPRSQQLLLMLVNKQQRMKVLADPLFFSKNCSKRQMMNSLWTESSLRNSTAISQSNLCNCLYSHNSCFTSSSVLGAKYILFNTSRVRISISVT